MLRMYRLTILFSFIAWYPLMRTFSRGPVANEDWVVALYGSTVALTSFSFISNVLGGSALKSRFIEFLRIPIAAIALGINSAYYHVSFVNPQLQVSLTQKSVQYLWLGVEGLLVLSLVIGIKRYGSEIQPVLETT